MASCSERLLRVVVMSFCDCSLPGYISYLLLDDRGVMLGITTLAPERMPSTYPVGESVCSAVVAGISA